MKQSLGAKTVVYPAPVFVIGTYDKEGKANAMTVAWGNICCSDPPCAAISLRKATLTYDNIVERKAFTINIPSETYVKEADYFGIASGKKIDKISIAGLTPVKSALVDAPFIEEFPFVLECKLTHTIELGLHTQFIGQILDIKADESVVGKNRSIDIEKVKPIIYAPEIRKYFGLGKYLGKAFSMGKKMRD
jgi:flavin reductase (DIM6/NTAB) family NADH-FMN oxidoreductase RutF